MPDLSELGIRNAILWLTNMPERRDPMPTPEQVRAARAWLGLSQDDFVAATGIPKRTLARLEMAGSVPYEGTLERIRMALAGLGVEPLFENGIAVGIRIASSYAGRTIQDLK